MIDESSRLTLDRVSKDYPGGVHALSQLSCQVASDEFLVITGPSGCGKTTALRIVAGLEVATSGSVHIDGQDVTHQPPSRRHVAMVLQDHPHYPHLDVRDNILFGLKGEELTSARAALDTVASQLGIADLLARESEGLSGGQSQRVALARALVRRRRVLLMDEPLSNVDRPTRVAIGPQLRRLAREQGAAVVYVTHNQAEGLSLADRMIVMRAGRVEQIGTPHELYRRPANRFVAEFVTPTPLTFVTGRCVSGPNGPEFQGDGWSFPLPGGFPPTAGDRPIVLGLRDTAFFEAVFFEAGSRDARGDQVDRDVRIKAKVVEIIDRVEDVVAMLEYQPVASTGPALRFRARLNRRAPPPCGETIETVLDLTELLWFDAKTGERLDGGAN